MNWDKHQIEVSKLPQFCKEVLQLVKTGNEIVNHCYCFWKTKESDVLFLYPLFDFLDHTSALLEESITEFIFYQPLNSKT